MEAKGLAMTVSPKGGSVYKANDRVADGPCERPASSSLHHTLEGQLLPIRSQGRSNFGSVKSGFRSGLKPSQELSYPGSTPGPRVGLRRGLGQGPPRFSHSQSKGEAHLSLFSRAALLDSTTRRAWSTSSVGW